MTVLPHFPGGADWRRGIKARTRHKLTHLADGFPEAWVNSERAFEILHERIAVSAYCVVGGNYQYFTKCVGLGLLEVRKTGGRLQWRRKAAETA